LDDENLHELDEQARQRTLEAATKTTTEKVKKALASQIAAYIKGVLPGAKGGTEKEKTRKRKRRLKGTTTVADVDAPKLARMLPYK